MSFLRDRMEANVPASGRMSLSVAGARQAAGILLIAFVAIMALRLPFPGFWLPAGILVLAGLQWRFPLLWLYVGPVLIGGLNLSPWTGWISFGVLDLFIGMTLAVELLRAPPATMPAAPRLPAAILALFGLSMAISLSVALWPFSPPTENSFFDYLDPYNAVRVFRGLIWTLAALWLARQSMAQGIDVPGHFLRGIAIAVMVLAAEALHERFVYADIFPFLRPYRVIGSFASMHVGGSHIGAFLVLGLPVSFMLMLTDRMAFGKLLGAGALLTGGLTLLLTFSRAAWLGTACGILVIAAHSMLMGGSRGSRISLVERFATIGIFGAIFYMTSVVAEGGFLQKRLTDIPKDLQYRLSLTADAVDMMDPGWPTRIVGMGLGSFPRYYYSRNKHGVVASRHGIVTEGGERFLRTIGGKDGDGVEGERRYNVGQRIRLEPHQTYTFSLRAKSPTGSGLRFEIKERHILNHRYGVGLPLPASFSKDWQRYEVRFDSEFLGKGDFLTRRSHSLLFFSSSPNSIVDIDDVRLVDRNGRDLIRNGNFSDGHDHWVFEAQNHVAYQVKDAFAGVYFEQGLLGLASLLSIFLCAIAVFRRMPSHVACISGLLGFAAFSFFDNVLTSPRLFLMFMFYWFIVCLLPTRADEQPEPAP